MSEGKVEEKGGGEASSSQPKKKKGGVKWDEENLMVCESEKSATMKIDEPKTPYNQYQMSEDAEVVEALEGDLTDQLAQEMTDAADSEKKETSKPKFAVEEEGEEEKAKKKEFDKKRKAHYNEFEMIKLARQKMMEEEEEEDEE
mmetsp:Transcript_16955/g.23500  ORF Transcript_16955/g.23500 Transcript_16955/m.23500 type:complete len:144 (+) Transcript_16955:75-506(+)|eukprot:CAMPEP_0201485918 /NCGR_PEP_ID=MMETSP0151_2-20130828/10000_1 /ASSEMBLY_ACC=CAM_ASM_000257 /TAXON_ID=200890 /ORGANISM="Paramoeba atlantica, Strain 621/1 / CCAP 1560/9" /LENGTH=143 /DNA_ID=CAMNT_0047870265 /DNA_START=405 /DNA_END=836 /DNA_ORIENTATION=+